MATPLGPQSTVQAPGAGGIGCSLQNTACQARLLDVSRVSWPWGGWEGGDFCLLHQNPCPCLPALSHLPQAAVPWRDWVVRRQQQMDSSLPSSKARIPGSLRCSPGAAMHCETLGTHRAALCLSLSM